MTNEIQYDPSAAHTLLKTSHLREIEPDILSAREEIAQDVELLKSEREIPADKEPLDAGFVNLPAELLDEYKRNQSGSLTGRLESTASQLREEIDRLVVLGIGGSYMGARALFEA
ncbi:MAG: glucose-6-phosphate isomerase, partial [Planctomycetes bacterium]|nr:glucose-6-phosphate isomerase [Planctomycetota bacterium]